MKYTLSKQAEKIFQYIAEYQRKHNGQSPSIRDIGSKVNLSVRRVLLYVIELERAGMIKRSPYKARSIEILESSSDSEYNEIISLPVVGLTSGGEPILADNNIQDYIPVSKKLIGPKAENCYLLKVKGYSMHPYLSEGDFAVVRETNNADNNDIVVASFIDYDTGEYTSTIKRLKNLQNCILLQPINPEYEPIDVDDKSNFRIQGKVIGAVKFELDWR